MRAVARAIVERLLLPLAPGARRRLGRRGGAAILSYHNVAPDDARPAGDASLHLPLSSFLDQVDRLARTHQVVALDALASSGRGDGRPLAAITFDDAYRGALALAVPALGERGLPATIFVPPGLIGDTAFWWDELAAPGGAGLDDATRAHALEVERGRPPRRPAGGPGLRPDQGPVDRDALSRAASVPGITLASHTWSHPNLTVLGDTELEEELDRPRAWLRDHYRERSLLDAIAFPYGLWDERVAATARRVGYRWLFRVEGGVAGGPPTAGSAIPRINVPAAVSGNGFALRVAGVVGSRQR